MPIKAILKVLSFFIMISTSILICFGGCSANKKISPIQGSEKNESFTKSEIGETYNSESGSTPYKEKSDMPEASDENGINPDEEKPKASDETVNSTDKKAISSSEKNKSSIDNDVLNKLKGDWVCNKYLTTLKENKSPLVAEIERNNNGDLSYVSIKQDEKGYYLAISYGFHNAPRGNIVKFQRVESKYIMEIEGETISANDEGVEKYTSQFQIVFENISTYNDSFCITDYEYLGDTPNGAKNDFIYQSDNKKYTFTKLGDIQQYMNNLIIKGDYIDEKGDKFVFTDSMAVFPNVSFKYYVNYDSFNYMPDYIYDPNSSKNYFYAWNDNYLDLYTSPNGMVDAKTFVRVYHLNKIN